MKAVIDTNVIVDVLQNRQPWCKDGRMIFLAIATNQIIGCITAKQAADIHFFSRKQFTGQENVNQKARDILSKLLTLFELLDSLAIDGMNSSLVSALPATDRTIVHFDVYLCFCKVPGFHDPGCRDSDQLIIRINLSCQLQTVFLILVKVFCFAKPARFLLRHFQHTPSSSIRSTSSRRIARAPA